MPVSKKDIESLPHVLVIDDDERLRDLLFRFLSDHDFLVTAATGAAAAREILDIFDYDAIVCDVMMPEEDGFSFTRRLRQDGREIPVLFLTALGDVDDRITGFEAGGDDYLPKPFEPRELLLRLHALLRRAQASQPAPDIDAPVRFGKLELDLARGEMSDGNNRIPLTAVEHTLLKALASKRGEIVSREELAALCQLNASERAIDVQITRLRKKVEEDPKLPRYIQTVRGKGYVLWSD